MRTIKRSCQRCGWSNTYKHPGQADYGKKRHSCARQIALAEKKAQVEQRRAERIAARDTTPKPCHHEFANHEHGTHVCYVQDKCRCDPCTAASTAYEANRSRMVAYGRSNNVAADPARRHVEALMAQGMGWKRIAATAGVSTGCVWKLIWGKRRPNGECIPSKNITRQVEAKLLATTLDLADGALVDATRTRRRIQALVAIGYSQTYIAQRLGAQPANFTRTVHYSDHVSVGTDRAMREIYDELSMTPRTPVTPSVARAKNYAHAHGWLPPLAWDDIDDPDEFPTLGQLEDDDIDENVVERVLGGEKLKCTKDERAEVIRRWRAGGKPLNELIRITGWRIDRYFDEVAA